MGKIALFTSFYHAPHEIRNRENLFCLRKNLNNPLIDRIFIFHESGDLPKNDKITDRPFSRPTYSDCFKLACSVGYDYSIISNTDIFFDSSLSLLDKMNDNDCFALSRWEYPKNVHFARQDSQDTWIFKGAIKHINGNFELGGVPGCDNRIAYEINQAGYKVTNPSRSIKTFHNHSSNVRYYNRSKVIQPPYLTVPPCAL